MTVQDMVTAAGGVLVKGDPVARIGEISVDSRSGLSDDGLFVAIPGEKTDGHRYIEGARASGAAAVLYCRDVTPGPDAPSVEEKEGGRPDFAWIRVPDTRKALQAVGAFCRERLTIPVLAVTGSVGKTTTREMTALALSAKYRTFKTEKNYNSQLGVPIMLSRIGPEYQAAVLEAGMSEPGEMARLAPIIRPDLTIFTNIGVTHIENLGSREAIFREKFELARAMKPGSPLIVNGDNDILSRLDDSCGYRVIRYGLGENCQVRAEEIRTEGVRTVFTAVCGEDRAAVRLQVAGEHMVRNALAALAAAKELSVPWQAAADRLGEYGGFAGRQLVEEIGGVTVICDYYNASPDSMKAALGVLAGMACEGCKTAVLADMNELGPDSAAFHREVGRAAAECGVTRLITVGERAQEIARGARETSRKMEIFSCKDNQEAADLLLRKLKKGDLLLLKGSHSMELGRIREKLPDFAESGNAGE